MRAYEQYEIDDFLQDEFFVEWVLVPQKEHEDFWTAWLLKHPERSERVDRAKQILLSIKLVPAEATLSSQDLSLMMKGAGDERANHEGSTNAKKIQRGLVLAKTQWMAAAAAVVILAVGLTLYFSIRQQPAGTTEVVAKALHVVSVSDSVKIYNSSAVRKMVIMEDSSVIILAPHSELSYASGFNQKLREITFNGKGFFEINHDEEKPFVIYSNGIVTKVLGTSFTLRSFASEENYHIEVNTGKVQVTGVSGMDKNGKSGPIVLLPNQQLTYSLKTTSFKESSIPRLLPLSEKAAKKTFHFSNTPFGEVMRVLEDAYEIKIQWDQEKLSTYTITASLSTLPLDEKIKMICRAVNAEFTYQDGDIVIH